jgi:HK97 gp10 family phage protein
MSTGDYKTDIAQVIRNLSKMKKEVVTEIVAGAETVQAKVTEMAKASLYPGHGWITGNLQGSIQPGGITITDDNVEAIIVANADYASFVEFGTSRMGGIAFMTSALLQNMAVFTKAMAAAVKRGTEKLG